MGSLLDARIVPRPVVSAEHRLADLKNPLAPVKKRARIRPSSIIAVLCYNQWMIDLDVLRRFDHDERVNLREPGYRRVVLPDVVRLVDTIGKSSTVIKSNIVDASLDRVIVREIHYFSRLGHELEWKWYGHDTSASMPQRLLCHGFSAEDRETLLALDLDRLPPNFDRAIASDVRRVTTPGGLADVQTVWRAVYEEDRSVLLRQLAWWLETVPKNISVYVGYVDQVPVATGRIQFSPQSAFATIWGGAVIPAFRGQGLYRDLLQCRANEARQRGRRYLAIDAGPMSLPIVQAHGFFPLSETQAFTYRAPP